MTLCLVSSRFYPVIGGVEIYLKNIAEYCSSHFKTFVVTSNLKNYPRSIFEKSIFLKKQHDILPAGVEIIRAKTLNNVLLKSFFYANQYLNKKIEIYFDKFTNPYSNNTKKIRVNKKLSNFLIKSFILQRNYANPNFSQAYYILKKIHKDQNIQVVHSTPIRFTTDICAFRFSIKRHIPFICTPLYHINPYADYILYPSINHILKNSDAIIACTDLEKQFYRKHGVDEKKIHIIPPGIDPNKYKKSNIAEFKKKFGIPEDAPILLFMGRRDYYKGVLHCIHALNTLIKKYSNIVLLIAGPSTREYTLFYNKLSSKLKNHIIDLGIVDNNTKTTAFSCCDVFLLPSLDDAFGIVYLEAWLFKKPVIGALGGNVESLIDNNVNGFLVPFKNIEMLISKIEVLLENEEIRLKFGQNGYRKLINNYTLDITNEKMLNIYKIFI